MHRTSAQYTVLLIAVLFLSTSAIFVKLADAPSAITAFYRMLFSALILLPFVLLSRKRRAELRGLSSRQWGLAILSGAFLACHYMLWFESLRYTSVASSTVLVTLQPLFSFIGGYFLFGERYSKKALMGCVVAVVGCFVIGWGDLQLSLIALIGDIMALAAAGIITAYFLLGQHVRANLSVVPYSFLGYVSSSVFLGLYALVQHTPFSGYPVHTWACFIGLAFVPTILGQMTFNWLLQWLSACIISMSILGEAVGTCILSYFILSERISLQQGAGILIILGGLAFFLYQQSREKSIPAASAVSPQTVEMEHIA